MTSSNLAITPSLLCPSGHSLASKKTETETELGAAIKIVIVYVIVSHSDSDSDGNSAPYNVKWARPIRTSPVVDDCLSSPAPYVPACELLRPITVSAHQLPAKVSFSSWRASRAHPSTYLGHRNL
ncbi:hypothetical protein PUNSTDRAFT_134285 [Punctularia strigosozonata HHB-11173 SS5]|uniref:uncharacterized protein n=1 Tax=Punctularia strigosozonata (strain HHB-11173) TaxID=741275 RepID=UPI0004416C08|nr:uncharacterized protein PUNSTDRAFT_134285 [Punctularia strigosozonata HHB-11173 SS5]EIN09118.1 hypothetical protein PUNSTDRAFT_134285 [Punctularia strigosozonata HHB-11173 SS5]